MSNNRLPLLTVIIFFLFIGGLLSFYKPHPVPLPIDADLTHLSHWQGTVQSPATFPFRVDGADDEKELVYPSKRGDDLHLYIAYFSFQEQGKELVGYATEKLYHNAVEIPVGLFRINKTVLRQGSTDYLILFWYDFDGRIVSSGREAKGVSLWNLLRFRKNNGRLILVARPIRNLNQEDRLLEEQIGFAQAVLSKISVKSP